MASIYSKAPESVRELALLLLEKNHFELFNHDLRIDFVIANAGVNDAGEPTGPAVSHGGYPALAVARILSTKDRVMGRGDCEIVIDGDRWPLLTDPAKDALIDHELEHFQIAKDKYGSPKLDDIHRPKLKLRKHDRQFGWFDSIAGRHGLASLEIRQFQELCYCDAGGQYYLPHLGITDHDGVKQAIVTARKGLREITPDDRAEGDPSGASGRLKPLARLRQIAKESGATSIKVGNEQPIELT